jgi:hypothetical protein
MGVKMKIEKCILNDAAASQEKDISEIVNWKKLEDKFTAYKDITTANGGSNTSAPHSQR